MKKYYWMLLWAVMLLVPMGVRAQASDTECGPQSVPYSCVVAEYGGVDVAAMCLEGGVVEAGQDEEYVLYPMCYYFEGESAADMRIFMSNGGYVILPQMDRPLSGLNMEVVFNAVQPDVKLVIGLVGEGQSVEEMTVLDTIEHDMLGGYGDVLVTYYFGEEANVEGARIVLMAPVENSYVYTTVKSVKVQEEPYCSHITGLTVVETTESSVSLTWDECEHAIEYSIEIDGFGTYQTTTNSITIDDLWASRRYTALVVANCGRRGRSEAAMVTFATECGLYSSINEYFDNSNGEMPVCWSYDEQVNAPYVLYGRYLVMESEACVVMPQLEMPLNEMMVRMDISNIEGTLVLGVVEHDGMGAAATFEPIDTIRTRGNYMRYLDDLTIDGRLALRMNDGEVRISRVRVSQMPSCLVVENLEAIDITENSITLDWTDHLPATEWRVMCESYDYYIDTVVTEHPVTLSDMRANEYYIIEVYTRCGEWEESGIAYLEERTEKRSCAVPTDLHVVSSDGQAVTLDWTENGQADEWYVRAYGRGEEYSYNRASCNHPPVTIATEGYEDIMFVVASICDGELRESDTVYYSAPCEPLVVDREHSYSVNLGRGVLPHCWDIEATDGGVVGDVTRLYGDTVVLKTRELILEDSAWVTFLHKGYDARKTVCGVELENGDVVYLDTTTDDGWGELFSFGIPANAKRVVLKNIGEDGSNTEIGDFAISIVWREECDWASYTIEVEMEDIDYNGATIHLSMPGEVRLYDGYAEIWGNVNTDEDGNVTVSGLWEGTRYAMYARVECGYGYTNWGYVGEFTTMCKNISELPYYADYSMNNCWIWSGDTLAMSQIVDIDLSNAKIAFYGVSEATYVIGLIDDDADEYDEIEVVDTVYKGEWEWVYFGNHDTQGKRIVAKAIDGYFSYYNYTAIIEEVSPCDGGYNLTATVENTEVTLDWIDIVAREEYYYELEGAGQVIGGTTDHHPFTVSGLYPGVEYTARIYHQIDTGDGVTCEDYISRNFVTQCGNIETLPYRARERYADTLPTCWEMEAMQEDASVEQWGSELHINGDCVVALPNLAMDIKDVMLEMDYEYEDNYDGMSHILEIGYIEGDDMVEDFVPVDTITEEMQWNTVKIYYDSYNGTGKRLAMRTSTPEGSGDYQFVMSDVVIKEIECGITDLHVVEVTDSSITIDWVEHGETDGWWVECGYRSEWVTEHPYTITGLEPANRYHIYVNGCGTDQSMYVYTDCGVNEMPYEAYMPNLRGTGGMPMCWDYAESLVADGEEAPRMYDYEYLRIGDGQMVVTPMFKNAATDYEVEIRFGDVWGGTLTIGLVDDDGEYVGSFSELGSWEISSADGWQERSFAVTADLSEIHRFAIRWDGDGDVNIRVVRVRRATCQPVEALQVTEVSTTSVTLDWADDNASRWRVAYTVDGNWGDWTEVSVTEHPYTVENLYPGRRYEFGVAAVCEDDNISEARWVSATTDCEIKSLPAEYTFDMDAVYKFAMPQCWRYDPAATVLDWDNEKAAVPMLYNYSMQNGNVFTIDYNSAVALPQFSTSVNTLTMEYDIVEVGGDDAGAMLVVGVAEDNVEGFATTFVGIDTLYYSDATMVGHHVTTYSSYDGEGVYLAFRTITPTDGEWHFVVIDNVVVNTTDDVCAAPRNVESTADTSTITISWEGDESVEAWEVMLGNDYNYSNNCYLVTTEETSVTFDGLDRGEWYEAWIRAICSDGKRGEQVNIGIATANCVLGVPTNVVVTDIEEQYATISWEDADDDSWTIRATVVSALPEVIAAYGLDEDALNAGYYYIQRTTQENPYTMQLIAGCTYSLRVAATCYDNDDAQGTWSEAVVFSMGDFDCQEVEDVQMVSVGEHEATFAWSDDYDNHYGVVVAAGANVWSAINDEEAIVVETGESTQATITGLAANTEYDFYVIVFCQELPIVSEPLTFSTTFVCRSPEALELTAHTATSLSVSWTTEADSTLVAISTEGVNSNTSYITTAAEAHTFGGLVPNTAYVVAVRSACDDQWLTLNAMTDTLPVDDTTYVCPPATALTVNVDGNSVTATWTTEAAVSIVTIAEGSTLPTAPTEIEVSANSYTFGSLAYNTEYTIGVRSQCDDEWLTATVVTEQAPDTTVQPEPCPTYSGLTATATTTEVTATWITLADISLVGIEEGEAWTGSASMLAVEGSTHTFVGLDASTVYTVAVRSLCDDTLLTYTISTDEVADTTVIEECVVPTGLAVTTVTSSSIIITWNTVQDAQGYVVRVAGAGATNEYTTTSVGYTINGLADSTTYSISVRTICDANAGRMSDWSEAVEATTLHDRTGIDDNNYRLAINIHPNPASTTANISVEGVDGQVVVSIIDLNGREVAHFIAEQGRAIPVDVSRYAQGVYYVRLKGIATDTVRKLIVR